MEKNFYVESTETVIILDGSTEEAILKRALNNILLETNTDTESFALLREICQETLGHKKKDECTGALDAPKSPQERLLSFAGKSRVQKRENSTARHDQTSPRWKKMNTEESPITDLTVVFSGDSAPDRFSKIERSPSGLKADLNKGGRGQFLYLCQSRDSSSNKAPIGEILVIFPERGECVPADYEIVLRKGVPANLNTGTQGEKIFLCIKRSSSSCIIDVMVIFPKKGEKVPYGYLKVDKSPDGHMADVNTNSGGTEVVICYKKKINCINELYGKWLYLALNNQKDLDVGDQSLSSSKFSSTCADPSSKCKNPKSSELRDEAHASFSKLHDENQSKETKSSQLGLKWPLNLYLYPLLMACYTRHGKVAEVSLQVLGECLDMGLFPDVSSITETCRLEVVVEAVASICHQGIKSRFSAVLSFFRKVIRKYPNGFDPAVLHAMLTSLTFIGDMDSSLVKSVEDELVYKIMGRYESERVEKESQLNRTRMLNPPLNSEDIARSIILNLIDEVAGGVEIAKWTESVLSVFRSHTSIHSPRFGSDFAVAMNGFIESTAEKNAYQLVVTFSKCVNRKATTSTEESGTERDRSSFVNSLRALNVALLAAGRCTKDHQLFGQLIRRFVFSTVNSISLVWSPEVFQANLTLVSTLWNHYRRHLKVELALLFEHLFLRILRSNISCAFNHQMDIMGEIMLWMQLPHNVVEIFLNFDMDRQFVQQWKIFEHLCAALCCIAEGNSGHAITSAEDTEAAALKLQIQSMNTILAIARSIMDASGHAHLIGRDARTRLLSMENGGWEQDDNSEDSNIQPFILPFPVTASATQRRPETASGNTNLASPFTKQKPRPSGNKYGTLSVRMRNELQKRNQQVLKRAMEISSSKSLKKAIEYLVAMNFVKETPRDITSFLRIYHDFFDECDIGDYLGEGDEDFKVQVRLTYVRAISFTGMSLVESLRHFLTNGGFRLPGEAQKIERMVEAFAQCYYEDSPTAFSSADTAMVIAYSIIMLNTDLHNPQVKKNKMSKEQFVKNNRGIDGGKDLQRNFLEEIYDDILYHPMHIKGSRMTPTKSTRDSTVHELDNDKFRGSLAKSVAQSEELMRDLCRSYYTFNFVGVDTCISPDLVKVLFERVWFYFLALSTSILSDNQSDLSMTTHCLDLLRFSISTCLFLGMPVERQAFCNLLVKVQNTLDENAQDNSSETYDRINVQSTSWMKDIEVAATADDPWGVMGDIHILVNKLKEKIQQRQTSETLKSVIKRISRGHVYLKDTTHFIREGDLTKRCRSRNKPYRFFLFNDQLLYADKGISGNWYPHNSLRLKLTRVTDVPDTVLHKNAFQILNPVKSFIVYAENPVTKADWIRLIEEAIAEAAKKTSRNARRFSVLATQEPTSSEASKSPMRKSSFLGMRSTEITAVAAAAVTATSGSRSATLCATDVTVASSFKPASVKDKDQAKQQTSQSEVLECSNEGTNYSVNSVEEVLIKNSVKNEPNTANEVINNSQ